MVSAIVSALHVLALALGLPAVYLRGRALKARLDRDRMRQLFAADTVWGIAAALWVVTGLLRAFAGLEKGSQFYLASPSSGPRWRCSWPSFSSRYGPWPPSSAGARSSAAGRSRRPRGRAPSTS